MKNILHSICNIATLAATLRCTQCPNVGDNNHFYLLQSYSFVHILLIYTNQKFLMQMPVKYQFVKKSGFSEN